MLVHSLILISTTLDCWRILNGGILPFDEAKNLAFQKEFIERQIVPTSMTNHLLAMDLSHELLDEDVKNISCRTLRVHGNQDPIIDPINAKKLFESLSDAKYVEIEEYGHVPNSLLDDRMYNEIFNHIITVN